MHDHMGRFLLKIYHHMISTKKLKITSNINYYMGDLAKNRPENLKLPQNYYMISTKKWKLPQIYTVILGDFC